MSLESHRKTNYILITLTGFEIPKKTCRGIKEDSKRIADQAVDVSSVKSMHICWMFSLRILISGSDQRAGVACCVFAVVYRPRRTAATGFITEKKRLDSIKITY